MEFASGLATGIVSKIGELLVVPVWKQFRYLIDCNDNINNLKEEHEKLKGKKCEVQGVVDADTINGREISPTVKDWLGKVDNMGNELEGFYIDEANRKQKCLGGWCPNLKSRYSYSKKAKKKAVAIVSLREVNFEIISYPAPQPGLGSLFTERFKRFPSRMSIMTEIMDTLQDDEFQRIGICGMGGVGKTTMVKELVKMVEAYKLFNKVAMAVVSQNPDHLKIQGQIAETIGSKLDQQTDLGRAVQLLDRVKKIERVLVVLDDIWTELDFELIGLPSIGHHKGCKILFTSRNLDVCNKMRCQKNFTISDLSKDEAWDLFQESAGSDVVDRHDIHDIAKDVANECGGLPIAIVTIGKALADEGKHAWENALHQLRKSPVTSFSEMQEFVYSRIQLSYDFLGNDEEAKLCLLLCCLFPEDYEIPIEVLLRHGLGLGLFKGVDRIYEARNRVHSLVDKLKNRFLLLDDNYEDEHIKMHDVVRDVVMRIATKMHWYFMQFDAEIEWPKEDTWGNLSALSLMFNEVKGFNKEIDCPNLKLLQVASSNGRQSILEDFFHGMRKAMVLGVQNLYIPSMPSIFHALDNLHALRLEDCEGIGDICMIGKLRNLKILSFAKSDIKQLPEEIGQLGLLRLLDLTDCNALYQISSNIFNRLSGLEELYFRVSYFPWEQNNVTLVEFKSLLCQLKCFEIALPDIEALPKDLDSQILERFWVYLDDRRYERHGYLDSNVLNLNGHHNFVDVSVTIQQFLRRCEKLSLVAVKCLRNCNYEFLILKNLRIVSCDDLECIVFNGKYLAKLQELHVLQSSGIECIISYETRVESKVLNIESLELESLPSLVAFAKCMDMDESRYSMPQDISHLPFMDDLLFPKLKILRISGCDKISSLFSASSAASLVNLEELEIVNCQNMKEIVRAEADARKIDFPGLQELELFGLSNLKAFCCGSCDFDFPLLQGVFIYGCERIEAFSFGSSNSPKLEHVVTEFGAQLSNTMQDLNAISGLYKDIVALKTSQMPKWTERVLCHFIGEGEQMIFHGFTNLLKVVIPISDIHMFHHLKKLEIRNCHSLVEVFESEGVNVIKGDDAITHYELQEMSLISLPKLTHIWENLGGVVSFHKLRRLKLEFCRSLKSIMSPSMARSLVLLQYLFVDQCSKMEEIVSREEEETQAGAATLKILFPELNKLKLRNLPNLKCFSTGNLEIELQSCEQIEIEGCPKMLSFCNGTVSTPKLSHMRIDSDEYQDMIHTEDLNMTLYKAHASSWNIKMAFQKSESISWIERHRDQSLLDELTKLRELKIEDCEKLLNCIPSTMIPRFQHLEGFHVKECE